MIVKKVSTSRSASPRSKARHLRALADYIAGPNLDGAREKLEHRGAFNLLNLDHDGQVQEMIDLAELARRNAQPVQHWIMSWREGEQPTRAQADEAVKVFLDEMGLESHQLIYALHRDTHNWHVHLALNRVHPDTKRLVTVNNRFDHEVAHRAIARIEHLQGWQSEARALFRVREDGRTERARPRGERDRKPSLRARAFEERTGARSAERLAIDEAAPAIRSARSWPEMHQALGERKMRLERKGPGAILWVGDRPVKASSSGRDCSLSALEKRFGEFEPARGVVREVSRLRTPEPIMPSAPGWKQYIEARHRHCQERSLRWEQLTGERREERQRMVARHRRERTDILRGSWKGRGALRNAIRSVLAARQAEEWAHERDRHRLERGELQQAGGRFPSYEEWLHKRDPELAEGWRHRERELAGIRGTTFARSTPQTLRAFAPRNEGGQVQHQRIGEQRSERDRPCAVEVPEMWTRAEVYRRHLVDVTHEHPGGSIDPSRVDLEIAVRMRLSGQGREEIEQTIKEVASRARPGETRDWDAYAKRTATVAFGVPGDRLAERLAQREGRWRPLDGRHHAPERLPPGSPSPDVGLER